MGGGGVDVKQSGQGEPEGIICGKVSVPGRGATGAKTLDGKCAWFWKELQPLWLQQREPDRKQIVSGPIGY